MTSTPPSREPLPQSPLERPADGPLPEGRLLMDGFARWVLPSVEPRPERVPHLRRQVRRVLQLWHLESLA